MPPRSAVADPFRRVTPRKRAATACGLNREAVASQLRARTIDCCHVQLGMGPVPRPVAVVAAAMIRRERRGAAGRRAGGEERRQEPPQTEATKPAAERKAALERGRACPQTLSTREAAGDPKPDACNVRHMPSLGQSGTNIAHGAPSCALQEGLLSTDRRRATSLRKHRGHRRRTLGRSVAERSAFAWTRARRAETTVREQPEYISSLKTRHTTAATSICTVGPGTPGHRQQAVGNRLASALSLPAGAPTPARHPAALHTRASRVGLDSVGVPRAVAQCRRTTQRAV
jgi:hypothetical protein